MHRWAAQGTASRWWLAGVSALLVSGAQAGLLEDDEARKAILDLRAKLQARNYVGLNLQLKEYNQSHGVMFLDSFADALRVLFP